MSTKERLEKKVAALDAKLKALAAEQVRVAAKIEQLTRTRSSYQSQLEVEAAKV